MSKWNKFTTDKFKLRVYDLVGDEYTVLGEYVNAKTKILIQHNACGNIYEVRPDNFLSGNRCPKCKRPNYNRDTRQFKEEVNELVKNEYSILSEYTRADEKIVMEHNKCGYKWKITPQSFLNGTRCPKCSGNIKNKTTEYFKEEVKELVGDEYTILGEYINNNTKIAIKHNKCGHEYKVTPDNFLRGRRCPQCNRPNYNMDTDDYKKLVQKRFPGEFEIIGEYTSYQTKILTKHNKCGNSWAITPSNLLKGHGCPYCNESKGERVIRKYLRKNHIKYRGQYKIKECKNEKPLPFDFALFDKDKLIALVEYQGIQHYESIELFGGEERFKQQKRNDSIKRNYCKANNIPLIEIPYTVGSIEEYLDKQLLKLNKPIQLALTK